MVVVGFAGCLFVIVALLAALGVAWYLLVIGVLVLAVVAFFVWLTSIDLWI